MNTSRVIMWSGKYHADAVDAMETARKYNTYFHYTMKPRIVGTDGNWKVVAEFKSA